jgi:hypothetical protein
MMAISSRAKVSQAPRNTVAATRGLHADESNVSTRSLALLVAFASLIGARYGSNDRNGADDENGGSTQRPKVIRHSPSTPPRQPSCCSTRLQSSKSSASPPDPTTLL